MAHARDRFYVKYNTGLEGKRMNKNSRPSDFRHRKAGAKIRRRAVLGTLGMLSRGGVVSEYFRNVNRAKNLEKIEARRNV